MANQKSDAEKNKLIKGKWKLIKFSNKLKELIVLYEIHIQANYFFF